MLVKILILLFPVLIILFSPLAEKTYSALVKVYKTCLSLDPLYRGKGLQAAVDQIYSDLTMGKISNLGNLPSFLGIDLLVVNILELNRNYGSDPVPSLLEVSEIIRKGISTQTLVKKESVGLHFQLSFLVFITISFIFFCDDLFQTSFIEETVSISLISLLSGVALGHFFLLKLMNLSLKEIGDGLHILYSLRFMVTAGLPLNSIKRASGFDRLRKIRMAKGLEKRLALGFDESLKTGQSPLNIIDQSIRSYWERVEYEQEKVIDKYKGLKFLVLAFFGLCPYLYSINRIFQFFLSNTP